MYFHGPSQGCRDESWVATLGLKIYDLFILCYFHLSKDFFLLEYRTKVWCLFDTHAYYISCPFNPLNAELNSICYLLALLAHHFFHVSRIRVKSLTLRLLMLYIYKEHLFLMFLDHTRRRSTLGRTPLDE